MKKFLTYSVLIIVILAICKIIFGTPNAFASELDVICWNVESGDADPQTLVKTLKKYPGIEIWGFSEVLKKEWSDIFLKAISEGETAEFKAIMGTTGRGDKLLIVFNSTVLTKINHYELHDINPLGRVRAPLVAHFKLKSTGTEFLFMTNHLYRSKAQKRHKQALQLNEWAKKQTLPVVAVGDYNFDWNLPCGENSHDKGFDNLTKLGVFRWVKPEKLLPTQCSKKYKSVLDFVFLSYRANGWLYTSEILESQASFCPDDKQKSDHRPIKATFFLNMFLY